MVVDLPVLVIPVLVWTLSSNLGLEWKYIRPERVHVGVNQDLDEWKEEIEDQPDVNHFDIGGLRQVVRHIDEHGG